MIMDERWCVDPYLHQLVLERSFQTLLVRVFLHHQLRLGKRETSYRCPWVGHRYFASSAALTCAQEKTSPSRFLALNLRTWMRTSIPRGGWIRQSRSAPLERVAAAVTERMTTGKWFRPTYCHTVSPPLPIIRLRTHVPLHREN